MVDTIAPWLTGQAAGNQPPVAPWLSAGPSVAEDLEKTAPSAAARGVLGLAGLGGDLQNLVQGNVGDKVSDWLTNASKGAANRILSVLPDNVADTIKQRWNEENERAKQQPIAQIGTGDEPGTYKLPSTGQLENAVTDKTGMQFHDPQTGPGRILNTALEVAPSLVLGGETLPGTLMKAAASGATSEGVGDLAATNKQYLPPSMEPYAEPVARSLGAIAGVGVPATVRRAVTPLPMAPEQQAAVTALRQSNPELVQASTAGQLTDTPGLRALEGRTTNNAVPQEQAYTQGAMRTMGANTPSFQQGMAQGDAVGNELRTLRESNNINPLATQGLMTDMNNMRRQFAQQYGSNALGPFDDAMREVGQLRSSPTGPYISGSRYGMVLQNLQNMIEGAPNSQTKMALSALRDRVKGAFRSSVPQDVADREQQLAQQYANYSTLSNVKPNLMRDTVTPQDVLNASQKQMGAQAVNRGRGELVPHAQDAAHIMQELPEASSTAPPGFNLLMTLLNGGMSGAGDIALGGHGLTGGAEGAVLGHLVADPVWNYGANIASRVANTAPAQAYLRNQIWTPGAHTSGLDRDTVLRLLLAPPVNHASGH